MAAKTRSSTKVTITVKGVGGKGKKKSPADEAIALVFRLLVALVSLALTSPVLWRFMGRCTKSIARITSHHKVLLAPWAVATLLVAVAVLAHFVAHPQIVAAAVLAACILTAALYARTLRITNRKIVAVGFGALTGLWSAWACLSSGKALTLTGLALFVAVATSWWTRYRPQQKVAVELSSLALTWQAKIAPKRVPETKVLPGSERPIVVAGKTVGVEGIVQIGEKSDLTASDVIRKTESIAAGLGLNIASVVVAGTDEGRADQVRVQRLDANPLMKTIVWPGPDFTLETGTSTIGVHPDGTPAEYVWVLGTDPWHDLIAGTTGAGKSALINQLLAQSRAADGAIVDWIGDPQQGQSFPEWMDHVDRAARGVPECIEMLRAAYDVMLKRNEQLANWPWSDAKGRFHPGFDHFPWMKIKMPLLVVTIDEAHMVLADPEGKRLAEAIGKMARKCGVKLRLIVQVPLLDQLGGSMTLRSMVSSGNVIVFRTADSLTQHVAFNGTLPVQPNRIPKVFPGPGPAKDRRTSGLGYIVGANAKEAPMRTFHIVDSMDYTSVGRTWHLDEVSATAAGPWPRKPLPNPEGGAPAPADDDQRVRVRDRIIAVMSRQPNGVMKLLDLAAAAQCGSSSVYREVGEVDFLTVKDGVVMMTNEGEAA